ncbi:DUF624 domain-containing protein [Gracilibacillus dipsosauri]|uniref:DUF624 domain-containing protein n=1 Tax=Gracilibacillus dipsosauri TaxID=178340 RepID=UPI002409399A
MHYTGVLGGFYTVADWVYKFFFVNIIWFFFNLPIVFLLFNLLIADSLAVIIGLCCLIFAILPFVFYPSIMALFSVVNQFIHKNEISIFRDYCSFFKENYKKSMKLGTIFTIFWAIFFIDFFYMLDIKNTSLIYLFLIIGFFGFIYQLQVFSGAIYMKGKLRSIWKHVAILMFGHPFLSMSLGLISSIYLYVMIEWFAFLLPIFSGSILVFFSLLVFLKIYRTEERGAGTKE